MRVADKRHSTSQGIQEWHTVLTGPCAMGILEPSRTILTHLITILTLLITILTLLITILTLLITILTLLITILTLYDHLE